MTSEPDDFFSDMEGRQINNDVNDALALYKQTRDGRYFWRAFLLLHESGRPIPQNFLDKLAQIGQSLLKAESTANIATALEFSGDERKYVGSNKSMAYERRWRVTSEVEQVKELYKLSVKEALSVVARSQRLAVSKVKADYHKIITASVRRERRSVGSRALAQQFKGWLK
jgi:hypothetical protein